eukprot:GHVO01040187.1.p1 GENE.GHVO01040187.1~~GHVO01040187.1.p1  ORF type:complete len:672 (+),score=114.13 GHVO01040187.1:41-2056(+)
MEFKEGEISGGKKFAVHNKSAATVQITAEQLLYEAAERQGGEVRAPRQRIVEEEELQEYRVKKRKDFEDTLRRQRHSIGIWIKYAEWEAAQKQFKRARSVFERALQVDYQNTGLWGKYLMMEVKNKFIQSARNLYDRVTGLLPRCDQFWFKYCHMEELLGNYAGARVIFERWMEWMPEDRAWMMYVHFEERCGEIERARLILERFLGVHPREESFIRFCKFEERHKDAARARAGYEKAIEILSLSQLSEDFFIRFAQFEEKQQQNDRARAIYESVMARLPESKCKKIQERYVQFQKQTGTRDVVEEVVLDKRRKIYEAELADNPRDYDAWFDYIRLEESSGNTSRIREVYERAISQVPPLNEKRYWKRYVYLWFNYAIYEELEQNDIPRCRQIWAKLVEIIPHKKVSFAKVWTYYAEFEIRQLQLDAARKVFGRAIAECGKNKIFEAYAALELRLGNLDRCRKIFAKFIERCPWNPRAWISLIELEIVAEEAQRVRRLCTIALDMDAVQSPELIWKTYIDFEASLGEMDQVRRLYDQLVERQSYARVYKAWAEFEVSQLGDIERAREITERGIGLFKQNTVDSERAELLAHLLDIEKKHGTEDTVVAVFKRQPKKLVKRRNIMGTETGVSEEWEEYTAYEFPDDNESSSTLKLMEAARMWKKQKAAGIPVM